MQQADPVVPELLQFGKGIAKVQTVSRARDVGVMLDRRATSPLEPSREVRIVARADRHHPCRGVQHWLGRVGLIWIAARGAVLPLEAGIKQGEVECVAELVREGERRRQARCADADNGHPYVSAVCFGHCMASA